MPPPNLRSHKPMECSQVRRKEPFFSPPPNREADNPTRSDVELQEPSASDGRNEDDASPLADRPRSPWHPNTSFLEWRPDPSDSKFEHKVVEVGHNPFLSWPSWG
ncbi:hypothetical protein CH63R_12648 [Colletotrichum higginsianum IMI 349063]|uniref:Uncharacterized protein n=1 Tax=Colletotrichum higginsianum (strain IMI 349063) TaxID=759273 RepID=A0A1B7XUT4_COLHI|nr:hypothetical protein CH63R_12648 [Colletotrichum higginsianum IMI 349063]OBR03521.1 hypothetical protein CH63R_12648 [Colletotrichum higginsianum IMI 349063]